MQTGDGLLVRIRVPGGRLDLDRLAALADCAALFGNGIIEISSRANLQLRGIDEAALPSLQRRLSELGLLDADAASESVRNIIASPLSDLDPTAIADTTPIVAALEARLRDDSSLHRLPPKFGFVVDDGGALPLGDVEADIRFTAFHSAGGPRFAVTLAGADEVSASCAQGEIADVAAALAHSFLSQAGEGVDAPRRMRALVARYGATALFAVAGLAHFASVAPVRRHAVLQDFLGAHWFGAAACVGVAPSLGRMTADDLRFLAREARHGGAIDVRFTPWRAFMITGLNPGHAEDFGRALAHAGFVVDPGDPRLAIVACSGAPACANAARAVQAEALELAPFVPAAQGIVLHVSGCEKGCAHGRAAPFTLVARKSGYDLVLDGKAADEPAHRALPMGEIVPLLARFAGRPN
jgi:precorrin-3B synthase